MYKFKLTFLRSNHPRFKREFAVSRHQPFGRTTDYQIAIQKADPTKISKLIKLVGMLMQSKVYLFWFNYAGILSSNQTNLSIFEHASRDRRKICSRTYVEFFNTNPMKVALNLCYRPLKLFIVSSKSSE